MRQFYRDTFSYQRQSRLTIDDYNFLYDCQNADKCICRRIRVRNVRARGIINQLFASITDGLHARVY